MIEPAEAVLAYSLRMIGARSSPTSRPTRRLSTSWFMPRLAWCSQKRRTCVGSKPSVVQVALDVRGGHRHHFLEDLAAFLQKVLSRASGSVSSQRFRKPALLRMLLLNCVTSRVPRICQRSAEVARVLGLDDHRGADVAEDEVAVAVAPLEVGRGDLGVDHQHALRAAAPAPRWPPARWRRWPTSRPRSCRSRSRRRRAPAGSRRPSPGRRAACWPRRRARRRCRCRCGRRAASACFAGVDRDLGHQARAASSAPRLEVRVHARAGRARRPCRCT